jgi:serine protease Do
MSAKSQKAGYILSALLLLITIISMTGCSEADFSMVSTSTSTSTLVKTVTVTSIPAAATSKPVKSPSSTTFVKSQSLIPDFIHVISMVRPSVVAITTETTGSTFFGSSFTQKGAGSGWIINKNGLIVTNNHVVEGASNIMVTLEDGRAFSSDSVHTDPVADLAIIQIDAQDLPALQVGDSSTLQAGEWVVAIGNSLGMGISATKGIVSALGVSLSVSAGETLSCLIQTDAAINPGNSGGPLVNLDGEVVGINSAKVSQVGVEGMGYSISVSEAKPIIDELIKNGYVSRPYLGASFYTVDQNIARRYRLGVAQGALITDIASSSPAEMAGLKPGDVITAFDNMPMNDANILTQTINSTQIGQKVQIVYWRGTAQNTIEVALSQSPPPGQ